MVKIMNASHPASTATLFRNHGRLLAGGFLLQFFTGFGQTVFIGAHAPAFMAEYDLSNTAISSFAALASLLSAILIIWTGKGMDTLKLTTYLTIILSLLATGCFIIAALPVWWALIPAFILIRHCAHGLLALVSNVAMNRYLEDFRGRATAISGLGGSIINMVFPFIALIAIEKLGLHMAWLTYGLFIVFVLIPGFIWLFYHHDRTVHATWLEKMRAVGHRQSNALRGGNEQDDDDEPAQTIQWTRKEVLTDKTIYVLFAALIAMPCFGTAILFYQAALGDFMGTGPLGFAKTMPFFTGASIMMGLSGGHIIDRFGEKLPLLFAPLIQATGLVILAAGAGGQIGFTIGMIFMGAAMGLGGVLGGPVLAKLYGTLHLGAIKSTMFSVMIIGTAISPPLVGFFLDHGVNLGVILGWFALYTCISWAGLFMYFRHKEL